MLIQGKLPVGLEVLLVYQTFDSNAGEQVTLIGFPSKTSTPWTVATGSLSGIKGRDLTFAAFVDEGNSGGPLLVKGKVVGVVVEVGKEVGFAVPSPTEKLALKGWGIELGRQARLIQLSWQHGNSGWALMLSLREQAKEIFYKLPGDVDFKSTGFYDHLNSETGLPNPRIYVATPELRERSIIQLKVLNLYGEEEGPYELVFDPREGGRSVFPPRDARGPLSRASSSAYGPGRD